MVTPNDRIHSTRGVEAASLSKTCLCSCVFTALTLVCSPDMNMREGNYIDVQAAISSLYVFELCSHDDFNKGVAETQQRDLMTSTSLHAGGWMLVSACGCDRKYCCTDPLARSVRVFFRNRSRNPSIPWTTHCCHLTQHALLVSTASDPPGLFFHSLPPLFTRYNRQGCTKSRSFREHGKKYVGLTSTSHNNKAVLLPTIPAVGLWVGEEEKGGKKKTMDKRVSFCSNTSDRLSLSGPDRSLGGCEDSDPRARGVAGPSPPLPPSSARETERRQV